MKKQQSLFNDVEIQVNPNYVTESQKRKWRNKLQEKCDEFATTEGHFNGFCICGHMSYCDLCKGVEIKNACARAITELCRMSNVVIDYNATDFNFRKFLEDL